MSYAKILLFLFIAFISNICYAIPTADLNRLVADQNQVFQEHKKTFDDSFFQDEKNLFEKRIFGLKLDQEIEPKSYKMSNDCIYIDKIIFTKNKILSGYDLAQINKFYNNKCLSKGQITELIKYTNSIIHKNGYTTSKVVLPKQNYNDNVLIVKTIQGKLENIVIKDQKDNELDYKLNLIFPNLKGDILNIRSIEQGLDQLNRLGSNNYTYEIINGKTRNGKILLLTNSSGREFDVSIEMFNGVRKSPSNMKRKFALNLYDKLDINDNIYFSLTQYNTLNDDKHDDDFYFKIDVPYGDYNFKNEFQVINTKYSTLANGTNYVNKSVSNKNKITVEKLLFRDHDRKLSSNLSFMYKNPKISYNAEFNSAESQNLNVVRLGLLHKDNFWNGNWDFDLGLNVGVTGFGAISGNNRHFMKYDMTINHDRKFNYKGEEYKYLMEFGAIHADRNIAGSEQLEIGDKDNIRGFDKDTISGDVGFYIRNEIVQTIKNKYAHKKFIDDIELFMGLDGGYVKNKADRNLRGTLIGSALGVRTKSANIETSLTLAVPINYPDTLVNNNPFLVNNHTCYFSVKWLY